MGKVCKICGITSSGQRTCNCTYSKSPCLPIRKYWRGLLLTGVQAASAGIFFVVLVYRIAFCCPEWLPFINRILGMGSYLNTYTHAPQIPFTEIFTKTFIFIFIQFFLLAGLFYISGKILGTKEGSFSLLLSAMSEGCTIHATLLILSALTLTFSPLLTMVVLVFGFFFTLLVNHTSACGVFRIKKHRAQYSTSAVYIFYFLLLSLLVAETLNIPIKW